MTGSLDGQPTVVLAALDHPTVTEARVTPDWERAYVFAAEGEATLWTPSVPELF